MWKALEAAADRAMGANDLDEAVHAAIDALLSECPVLGLTAEEVEGLLAYESEQGKPGCGTENCSICTARSKLLATRKALEEQHGR